MSVNRTPRWPWFKQVHLFSLLPHLVCKFKFIWRISPLLGLGSDYAPFVTIAGVPSLSVVYNYDPKLPVISYPLYHSAYDTFHVFDTYVDVGFKVHVLQHLNNACFFMSCSGFCRALANIRVGPFWEQNLQNCRQFPDQILVPRQIHCPFCSRETRLFCVLSIWSDSVENLAFLLRLCVCFAWIVVFCSVRRP